MAWLTRLWGTLAAWWGFVVALAVSGLALRLAAYVLFERQEVRVEEERVRRSALVALLAGFCLVLVILATPLSDATHGQLLSFFGILISAAIALSSTTLVGNIMAGVMLRWIRNFRHGDFIRVEDTFGRVSEVGLLHTEVQTEERDLATIPNLYMVQRPVQVVQSCGTVVSATVSLGYDIPRRAVEEVLGVAAVEAGLRDPFVQVLDLGDYSVTYRAAGFLDDVKILLSARSALRSRMMDRLHAAGVEIVSPTFMNQRVFPEDRTFLPRDRGRHQDDDEPVLSPESRIFDKADAAETKEQVLETLAQIDQRLELLQKEQAEVTAVELGRQIGREMTRLEGLKAQLTATLSDPGEAPSGDAGLALAVAAPEVRAGEQLEAQEAVMREGLEEARKQGLDVPADGPAGGEDEDPGRSS